MFTLTSISDSVGVSTWSDLYLKGEEVVGRDSLRRAESGRTMAILRVDLGLTATGALTPAGDMQD
jgi:hypothetical protein